MGKVTLSDLDADAADGTVTTFPSLTSEACTTLPASLRMSSHGLAGGDFSRRLTSSLMTGVTLYVDDKNSDMFDDDVTVYLVDAMQDVPWPAPLPKIYLEDRHRWWRCQLTMAMPSMSDFEGDSQSG